MNPNYGECPLPNGHVLCWYTNEAGGRTYVSDEVGDGLHVWDTALVDQSTLLTATMVEEYLVMIERLRAKLGNYT